MIQRNLWFSSYFYRKIRFIKMETNSVSFFSDKQYSGFKDKPLVSIWNIKNAENLGHIIRLVDNIGGEDVFLIEESFILRKSYIKRIAGMSYSHIKVHSVSFAEFLKIIPEGYSLVAIETSEGSKNIYDVKLSSKIAFLLGNESYGIPSEVIKQCSQSVYIPMIGKNKSMNISHALTVSLFEWQRQMLF